MKRKKNPFDTPLMKACLDMLKRIGTKDFRIGYSDEDEGDPIVWYAVVTLNEKFGGGSEAAAALDPQTAIVRLLERAMDGGKCLHCHKPTAFSPDPVAHPVEDVSSVMFCWYRFDPELETIRRSCEGTT